MNGELLLSDKDSMNQTEVNQVKFANFYLGGILFLIIYNFLIFLFLKDKIYLFYSFYAGTFTLTTLIIFGRFDQILNIGLISFSHYLICFSAASLFSACIFTFHFLEIKKLLPNYVKYFKFICITTILLFLSGLLPILGDFPKFFGIIIDIAIFTSILFFNYLAFNIVKKSSSAVFYLFSWGLILISLFVWFAMSFGFLSVNFITIHALPIGNMLEMLTLSFALAYKIQQLNADKFAALTKARDKDKYERLVRVLSHDVANSLTVVNSYSKKMIQNEQLDDVTRKQAEKIYAGSENIKSILQIVREQELLVSQNKQMNLELINVLECVQLSELLYEEMLSTKKIRLNINIEKNLIITADKICFINNILNNLISNAIKFSTENSEIKIYTEKTIDHNVICLRDFGIGIKSELINDIFYTNKIISTSGTNKEAGNGLGSNLVREYMLLFGGSISVDSKTKDSNNLDSGTLIKLFFPIER
jgi:adenylate cyclase